MAQGYELGVGYVAGQAFKGGASLAIEAGKAIGKAGFGAAAALGSVAGRAGLAGAELAGRAGLSLASSVVGSLYSTNPIGNPIGRTVGAAVRLGRNMVEYRPSRRVYNIARGETVTEGGRFRLTALGKGILLGGAAIAGVKQAYNDYKIHKMGTVDTEKTGLTPGYEPQEYSVQHPDFAGATGDLVFALHANRH